MAEHAICVSVSLRKSQENPCKLLVNKKIGKFSCKLTLYDIVEEVVGTEEVDEATNNALDYRQFDVKLSTTEHGETFTIDKDETLQTAVEFNPHLRFIHFIINLPSSSVKDVNNNENIPTKNAFECLMQATTGVQQHAIRINPSTAQSLKIH